MASKEVVIRQQQQMEGLARRVAELLHVLSWYGNEANHPGEVLADRGQRAREAISRATAHVGGAVAIRQPIVAPTAVKKGCGGCLK